MNAEAARRSMDMLRSCAERCTAVLNDPDIHSTPPARGWSGQAGLPHGDAQPTGGQAQVVGGRAGKDLGDAVVDPPAGTAEHEEVAAAQLDVGERARAAVDAGEAERAGVAQAERDHRSVGRLLAILVQAEAGAGRIEGCG